MGRTCVACRACTRSIAARLHLQRALNVTAANTPGLPATLTCLVRHALLSARVALTVDRTCGPAHGGAGGGAGVDVAGGVWASGVNNPNGLPSKSSITARRPVVLVE